jgi:hypothetical protein
VGARRGVGPLLRPPGSLTTLVELRREALRLDERPSAVALGDQVCAVLTARRVGDPPDPSRATPGETRASPRRSPPSTTLRLSGLHLCNAPSMGLRPPGRKWTRGGGRGRGRLGRSRRSAAVPGVSANRRASDSATMTRPLVRSDAMRPSSISRRTQISLRPRNEAARPSPSRRRTRTDRKLRAATLGLAHYAKANVLGQAALPKPT